MKTVTLVFLFIIYSFGTAHAQTVPAFWLSEYLGEKSEDNGINSRWSKLEIDSEFKSSAFGGNYVIYKDGEDSKGYYQYILKPKGNENSISFYFVQCQPRFVHAPNPLTSPFKKGELVLKLTKFKGKNEILSNYRPIQSLEISGTPAYVIGNKLILGAIDLQGLTKLIGEERTENKTNENTKF